ncbi:MAG: helix-turn-helix domain-containing protein [Filifactoraceae bacterium]
MVRIKLSKLLGERRMTQKELSQKTGIRAATINELYHELVDRINLNHVNKICEVLNCDVQDLLEYIPSKKKL